MTVVIGTLFLILAINTVLPLIGFGILEFAIGPDFTNLPYTSGGVVDIGWPLVRDLANVILVLILLVIGLATALKIKEYEAKKTLPLLIFVALLINFSRVIIGLIIDFSNILMNFFLEGVAPPLKSLTEWLTIQGSVFVGERGGLIKPIIDLLTQAILIKAVFLTIFNFLLSVGLFLYAVLFMLRPIALWILVILSPLAFVSYILPGTRQRVWQLWWNQLIQWCFIGVTAAFFLYVGTHLLAQTKTFFPKPGSIEGLGIYNDLLPYLAAVLFMIFGFLVSLPTSAIGATGIITAFQKGAKTTGAWATKKWWKEAKERGRERIVSSERVQQLAQRMATYIPRGRLAQVAGAPIWAIGRAMGRAAGPGLIETERKDIDEAEKKVAGQRVEAQMSAWASTRTNAKRIGILNAIIKDRNIEEAMDIARFGNAAITQSQIERLYDTAQARNKHNTLRAAFPEIARTHLPAGVLPTPPPPGISQAQHEAQYVFDRIRPADYEDMSRRVLTDNEFSEAMIRRGTDRHIHRFIDRFQIEGAIAVEERLRALTSGLLGEDVGQVTPAQMRQTLAQINPRLHRYFTSQPGQGLINI